MKHVEAYPLHWPEGWPRTSPDKRRSGLFDTDATTARDGLLNEVKLLGGTEPVLSTNVPTRQDNVMYARFSQPSDPGVAVYFTLKKQPRVFACDRWSKVQDNLQAVRKTIEALRGIERWGSSEMLNRIFQGFAALPEASDHEPWWVVLGVTKSWGLDAIEKVYRALAKEHHPDVGGDPEQMAKLSRAIGEARAEKRQ